MNWTLLANSVLVAGLATACSVVIGGAFALFLCGIRRCWRHVFLVLAATALALPPFLVTNCWLDLLGLSGRWRGWLPFELYSPGGAVWILTLMLWPVSAFLALGAWQRVESAQLEVEPALKGWLLVRWLLFPIARPALAQGVVLTFVLALNNFAVPALLQVKVFPAEVWVNFNTNLDAGAALRSAWPLVLAPLILLLWMHRREVAWPRREGTAPPRAFRRQLGMAWFATSLIAAATTLLSVALPLAGLAGEARTWQELGAAFRAGWSAINHSALFAGGAATLVSAIGLLTWRWRTGPLFWVPFLAPGVLLGIVLIGVFNRPALSAVYQSAAVVLVAWTLRYLAIGWTGASHAMKAVDHALRDAARLEGATGWQEFRYAHWPQIAPAVVAGWYVTYLLCLWDVETLVLIVPPDGETLALRIFNFLHYGHNAQVNALCLVLLALALAPLCLFAVWGVIHRARILPGIGGVSSCAALATALASATGCAPSGNEAVLDSRLFDRVQVIGERGAGLGQFNKPRSLTLDAQDNLYVVDMTGRVQKFSPEGAFVSYWQMEQTDKGKPKGMCRDAQGNIIVIEPHYSRVNHFTPGGQLAARWGTHGTNAGQLAFPRAAAVTLKGDVLVSEYGITERVQRFTAGEWKLAEVIGRAGAGPGEFNRPEGLCVDSRDWLYVADSCNHRIQRFSPEGRFIRAHGRAGSGPGELSYPYDVRVDTDGRQYVCEFGNSRIQIFDGADRPVEILGGPGAAPGRFSNPWSLALDSKGNLYVADSMNHRVQKFFRKESTGGYRSPGAEVANPQKQ